MPFNYQSNLGKPGPSGGNQQFASALMQLLSSLDSSKSGTGAAAAGAAGAATPPATNALSGATNGVMGGGFQTPATTPSGSKMSY